MRAKALQAALFGDHVACSLTKAPPPHAGAGRGRSGDLHLALTDGLCWAVLVRNGGTAIPARYLQAQRERRVCAVELFGWRQQEPDFGVAVKYR
jgi:hypothetical protein